MLRKLGTEGVGSGSSPAPAGSKPTRVPLCSEASQEMRLGSTGGFFNSFGGSRKPISKILNISNPPAPLNTPIATLQKETPTTASKGAT